MSSCERAVASPPWRRGCQVRAPWHHGAMGSLMPWDPQPRPVARAFVGTQECTQIGENGLSDPFWVICVHCCDARVASGGTSTPTAMACRQRPSVARPSLGRENRLCASGAATRLAFSPGCQPTQTPEEPAFCTVSFLLLRGFTLLSVRELRKDDRDGTTIGTTGIASGFLTRINEGHSPKEAPL